MFDKFSKTKKDKKEDKESNFRGEKLGSQNNPHFEQVLSTINPETHTKNIVISSSKTLEEGKDFGIIVANTKKIIVKDLLSVLRQDPHLRNKPLVYQLTN